MLCRSLPIVDQTADDDASFIGSIWGCRRANWTCSWIPEMFFWCISAIARSADSGLPNVTKPRLGKKTIQLMLNGRNWKNKPFFNFHRNINNCPEICKVFLEKLFCDFISWNEDCVPSARFVTFCGIALFVSQTALFPIPNGGKLLIETSDSTKRKISFQGLNAEHPIRMNLVSLSEKSPIVSWATSFWVEENGW